MELISAEDYASLPEEPTAKFVAFEEICRRNMNHLIHDDSPSGFDMTLRQQYMMQVSAAAEECGVEGLEYPWGADDLARALENFMLTASGIVTRFRLRNSGKSDAYSVRLASKTRGRIEQQIAKLRDLITNGDLPDDRRKKLMRKLDELSVELSQPRVSFGKVLAVLAAVGAGLVGTAGLLADAPHAIATITSLLGVDKEAEEAEISRLGPPPVPKALPPVPRALPAPRQGYGRVDDLDDEIPF